jgi:hypothetical protein
MFRSSDSTKLAEWRERFERFSSCGLAVARFCAQEHVSVASFYHWRKKLGHKGRRRRMTDGHPRHRTGLADGRGVFQPIAVVPAARGLGPVASGWVPAGRAVCIQLPCGTRIEVGADDLDAVRTVVAEVARAYRGCEVGRAEHGREAGVA